MNTGSSHPILPWMVRHAGAMLTRGQRGLDGRTPFEILKGNPCRKALPAFGEHIMSLPVGKRVGRLVDRWLDGISAGVIDNSDEVLVATSTGVMKARLVKRLARVDRADPALLQSMKGLPWDPIPGVEAPAGEVPAAVVKIVADKLVPDPPLPPEPAAPEPVQPRRLYIRREVEIARYGGTEGCPGCFAAAVNRTAASHSAGCRARFEMELGKDKVFGCAGRVIDARARRARPESGATTPNPLTKSFDFRGFDPSKLL